MKKWILWAGYTLICCYGCAGFLDEAPRDQLPEEDAYDTPANIYLNTVATLYNYVGGYEDSQGLRSVCSSSSAVWLSKLSGVVVNRDRKSTRLNSSHRN